MEQKKKLYTYTEDQINEVLRVLGELPAKQSLKAINNLMAPVKSEEVNEEKTSETVQQG